MKSNGLISLHHILISLCFLSFLDDRINNETMTSAMDLKRLYHDSNIDSRVSEQRLAGTSSEDETRIANEYTPSIEPLQIQVSSTFDADMILRKIIEDRSAILALRREADRNEKELLKAKVWQMQTSEQLSNAEKEISRRVAKARYDIAEYNDLSKQYINGFVEAFQHGDIDKLRHHPFLPSFKDLEEAIARRKALVIEKVQADDRVRKLEIISSRHHIAKAVLKKNEEAFVRAIAIAKQQFQNSCGSWLNQFYQLLSALPDQGTAGKKVRVQLAAALTNTSKISNAKHY